MKDFIIPLAIFSVIAFAVYSATRPRPEPLLEITFTDSNLFGVDVPFLEKEEKIYVGKTRPVRTQILGGSRYTFLDENGDLIELKGSYNFEVKQIGWIEIDDPRHSRNR
jgi:hypothetical protein